MELAVLSKLLISLIRGYKFLLSPMLGLQCRFTPTCSSYAIEAIQNHGSCAGTYLMIKRLCKCQPLCVGGHDPVPLNPPFSFLKKTN